MARLLFLGRLEDAAGTPELLLELAVPTPLADVLGRLPAELAGQLIAPRIRLAHNGIVVGAAGLVVGVDDELAFLPPVSGG